MSSALHAKPLEKPADAAARYRALFENMAEGYVVCEAVRGPDGRLSDYWMRDANPVFLKRSGYGDAVLNRRQLDVRPDTTEAWFEACERALDGDPVRFEFSDPLSGRWYEVHMARLSPTEFGQFFVDVTDRKTTEQQLVGLFQELNHRVKNHLAIAASILELQARASPREVSEPLRKAADRLHSIADLHASLYRQNSTDTTDLQPYLRDLCARLADALFEDGRVRIDVECGQVAVGVEQAVTLGLIVNELVTNAAKHAFPDGAAGVIRVAMSVSEHELRLTVADNGAGLPRMRPDAGVDGLGLKLVRSLAKGLGGQLRQEPGPGAVFQVRAPRHPPGV